MKTKRKEVTTTQQEQPGRDELNLAEFPLAVIGQRPPKGVKTLVFKDSVWDKGRGKMVERKLTVTASDLLGLPTQFDDEVLLGCIQLSKSEGFTSQRVEFTRYELLKLLGRPVDGRNFKRVSESLDRWAGVLVISDKAWWDRENQCWVKDTFSIIDRVNLMDRETRGQANRRSSLRWGDFMWQSFQSGNLKKLDFDFWKSLRLGTSKRLYRILDKRFYHGGTVTFDLHELAFEKLGLSRGMHTGQIKEKLRPANEELDARGVCTSMISKKERGKWEVEYRRKAKRVRKAAEVGSKALEELVSRGIGKKRAGELISHYGEEFVLDKVALFDWDKQEGRQRGAGFLVKAIEDDYAVPDEARKKPVKRPVVQVLAADAEEETGDPEFDDFFSKLSEEACQQLESDLLRHENRFFVERYESYRTESPSRFRLLRKGLFEKHAEQIKGIARPRTE